MLFLLLLIFFQIGMVHFGYTIKFNISLLGLQLDVESLSQINATKFMLDTAHQKEDLIHRLHILKCFGLM